jgi:hypothetical protein
VFIAIKKWIMARIELHIPYEQISKEKINMIHLALKTSVLIFNSFIQTNKTLDYSISLQYDFMTHIFTTPTINKYLFPLLDSQDHLYQINFKNLFSSYYFSKQVDMDAKEREEEKKDHQGNMINEVHK